MSILKRMLARLRWRLLPDYKYFHAIARKMRKAKREELVMGVSGCGKTQFCRFDPSIHENHFRRKGKG